MRRTIACLVLVAALPLSLPLPARSLAEDQPITLGPPVTLEAEQQTTGILRIVPKKKSLGLFLAAQAVLLIDMGQTLDIRNNPEVVEANPLLGREPSRERIYAIFGTRLAINTLAHWLLPDRWANGLSMLNLVVGVPVVASNASLGLSVSF